MEDLLLPEPFQRDLRSAEEARLRAVSLLCKLYLQTLDRLWHWSEFTFVWLRILDFVSKYMVADGSETMVRLSRRRSRHAPRCARSGRPRPWARC